MTNADALREAVQVLSDFGRLHGSTVSIVFGTGHAKREFELRISEGQFLSSFAMYDGVALKHEGAEI